jgi:prefoldin subunit 5
MSDLCNELEKLRGILPSLEGKNFSGADESQKRWFLDKVYELSDLVEYFCNEDLIYEIHPNTLNSVLSNLRNLNQRLISSPINFSDCRSYLQHLLYYFKYIFGVDIRIKKFPGYGQKLRQLKELNEKLSELLSNTEQIEILKRELESAAELLEEIKDSSDTVKDLVKKAQSLYSEMSSTKEKVGTLHEEVEAFYRETSELSENMRNLEGEFSEKKQEIEGLLQSNREQLEQLHKELEDYRQELDSVVKQAKKTLRWAEAAGLKTAFERRVDDLNKEVRNNFLIFLFFSFVTSLVAIFLLFSPELSKKYLGVKPGFLFSFGRVLLMGFIFSLLYAFWNNWQQSKLLRDDYAHKKILAENLMIGYKTLEEDLSLDRQVIAKKFLSPSMHTLLEDPVKQAYKIRVENPFSLKNLIPEKKMERKEEVEE